MPSGFSFGFSQPAATTAATGFSFGSTAPATTASFSFGFQTTQPAAASTAATAAPFSLSTQPTSTSSTSNTSTAPFGALSFGSSAASTAATTTATSGFSFGASFGKPTMTSTLGQPSFFGSTTIPPGSVTQSSTAVSASPTVASVTPFGGLAATSNTAQSLCQVPGGQSVGSKPTTTGFQLPATSSLFSTATTSSVAVTTTGMQPVQSTTPVFGQFGKPITTTSVPTSLSSSAISTTASVAPASLSSAATITTVSSTTTTSTPSGILPATKPTTMTYQQLEDAVNKWAHDLEEQERYFLDEADRITEWDDTLLKNGEKISTLYEKVNECKSEQSRLEQELDFIEMQQRDLEQLLEPLERSASELPPGHLHSDFEREAIFQLATNVDLELGQMLSDLRDLAGQVNTTQSRFAAGDEPRNLSSTDKHDAERKLTAVSSQTGALQQVTRILNCHMHSLKWIHQNTQELMDRLKVLEGS